MCTSRVRVRKRVRKGEEEKLREIETKKRKDGEKDRERGVEKRGTILPGGVNLMAFDRRLLRICVVFVLSIFTLRWRL
eukprot:224491-Amorphochlora_amoeboformis.AAC.1